MRTALVLSLLVAAAGAAWTQAALPVDFAKNPGWKALPSYPGNPAAHPRVAMRNGATELIVDEPRKGMKFELPLASFDCTSAEYLLLAEVQCVQEPARIAFASLAPADEVPAGADVWPRERAKEAEFSKGRRHADRADRDRAWGVGCIARK